MKKNKTSEKKNSKLELRLPEKLRKMLMPPGQRIENIILKEKIENLINKLVNEKSEHAMTKFYYENELENEKGKRRKNNYRIIKLADDIYESTPPKNLDGKKPGITLRDAILQANKKLKVHKESELVDYNTYPTDKLKNYEVSLINYRKYRKRDIQHVQRKLDALF